MLATPDLVVVRGRRRKVFREPCRLLELGELAQEMARALVPIGVVHQVQLMVLLGVPPLLGREDLGDDLATPPLIVRLLCDLLRNLLLLVIVVEDAAAVLSAAVGALLVGRRGVVHLVEEFEDLGVGETGGIVDQECSFGVFELVSDMLRASEFGVMRKVTTYDQCCRSKLACRKGWRNHHQCTRRAHRRDPCRQSACGRDAQRPRSSRRRRWPVRRPRGRGRGWKGTWWWTFWRFAC